MKRGSVAIVGVAESDLGHVQKGLGPIDLMAQATRRALDDSGLDLQDVDGIFAVNAQSRMPTIELIEHLGVRPRYADGTRIGGASFITHLAHAHAAIDAGLCEVALVAYGSTQRSVTHAVALPSDNYLYESPYRPMLPVSAYALAASRHTHLYGTTREQLAEVAVAARKWALLNPSAWEKEPLSVDGVLNARMVSTPLTVRDCCLVTDGGGAVIVTSADRAKSLRKQPIYVLGNGENLSHYHISSMPDFAASGAVESGKQAFAMAKLVAMEVDVCQIYDAFTINTIMFLEDLGFCGKGEGGHFVSGGRIAPGGKLPVNTSGGGLSYCHPGMFGIFLLIEAARQLRGECGDRQVKNCKVALAHGNGGVLSTQCTTILGTEDTL